LVGACASRRGTEDDEGQGRGLWDERVDLMVVVVDRVCEGEGVRGACQRFIRCSWKYILCRVRRIRPPDKKNVHYSPIPPHKTPSRTLFMRREDRGTSWGRGGDLDTGLSERLIVSERGTREESPQGERSVFKRVVVLHRRVRRDRLWPSRRSMVAAPMPFSLLHT
jgi:hypothetical protein